MNQKTEKTETSEFTNLTEPIDFVNEIDNNIDKVGSEWEIWSGAFNRNLRKKDPKKFPYIFSYWQVQNAIKTAGKTNERVTDLKEIKKIILE